MRQYAFHAAVVIAALWFVTGGWFLHAATHPVSPCQSLVDHVNGSHGIPVIDPSFHAGIPVVDPSFMVHAPLQVEKE